MSEYSKGYEDGARDARTICAQEISTLKENLRQTECAAEIHRKLVVTRTEQRNEANKRKAIYFEMLVEIGMSDEKIEAVFNTKEAAWNA